MTFRILRNESVRKAVQRIAREQIDKAIKELKDEKLDNHETVHQVRKRCKKIRGLIRLVRPAFGDHYDLENNWYRDAARPLSGVRDAQALLETFDHLTVHFQKQVNRRSLGIFRRKLTARRKEVAKDQVGLRQALAEFLSRMQEGRKRVDDWRLNEKQFDAVREGLAKTYGRARRAMKEASKNPDTEQFHEWRKRVKYHWYHMRLMQDIWKGPMKERRNAASLLADWLGDDHDLAVFRSAVQQRAEDFKDKKTLEALIGLSMQRQIQLRAKALKLGQKLLAEKPDRLTQRLEAYWHAWRNKHPADLLGGSKPVR